MRRASLRQPEGRTGDAQPIALGHPRPAYCSHSGAALGQGRRGETGPELLPSLSAFDAPQVIEAYAGWFEQEKRVSNRAYLIAERQGQVRFTRVMDNPRESLLVQELEQVLAAIEESLRSLLALVSPRVNNALWEGIQ